MGVWRPLLGEHNECSFLRPNVAITLECSFFIYQGEGTLQLSTDLLSTDVWRSEEAKLVRQVIQTETNQNPWSRFDPFQLPHEYFCQHELRHSIFLSISKSKKAAQEGCPSCFLFVFVFYIIVPVFFFHSFSISILDECRGHSPAGTIYSLFRGKSLSSPVRFWFSDVCPPL